MSGLRKPVARNREDHDDVSEKAEEAPAQPTPTSRKMKRSERIDQAVSDTHNQWLSSESDESGPRKEMYTEEEVPLGGILLDKTNYRTQHISVAHPTKNLLAEDHPDFQKNEDLIKNLIEFSEHLKKEPLRQLPGLYRDRGKLYTAYGNRRFLALLIAFGPKHVFRFKIYPRKPKDLAKARFQENSQREDVPLSDNIFHFQDAQLEAISDLQSENQIVNGKVVSRVLGISVALYSVYDRTLKRDLLVDLIKEGKVKEYRLLRELVTLKSDEEILEKLGIKPKDEVDSKNKKLGRGRPKTNIQFPKINNKKVFMDIINGRLSEFEWKEEDFESYEAMTQKLNSCIEQLLNGS